MHKVTLSDAFDEICRLDAPLSVRLASYADKLRQLNTPLAMAYDKLVGRLQAGAAGADAPAPGAQMPPFLLPAGFAKLVSLEGLLAMGPVVVSFDRGHWCPFCRLSYKSISDFEDELEEMGAKVVCIMPDRQVYAQRLKDESFEKLVVLTDIDNGYALSLGLVMWLGDDVKHFMIERGFRLETYHGNDGWYVPVPATFVVGRDGRVIARHVDPDFRKRMDIVEILDALRSDRENNN